MGEEWRRHVIDFHSRAVIVGEIRKELRIEGDLAALVRDNKKLLHQSRKDGGRGGGWERQSGKKMKEMESDKKRQRGHKALQQPLKKNKKDSVREAVTQRMLDREIYTSMSDSQCLIFHLVHPTFPNWRLSHSLNKCCCCFFLLQ